MYDTTIIPVGAVGTGKKSWNIPNSNQIAGLLLDNPSGSWLFIPQDRTYIPPYTMGFQHSFSPTFARVDILFSNGPSGQVSTQQGDPVRATIYDVKIGDSPGTPSQGGAFIEQFTPVLTISDQPVVPVSTGVTNNIIPATPNKRIRLLTCISTLDPFFSNPPVPYDTGISIRFFESVTGLNDRILVRLNPDHPVDPQVFANGLDCTIGAGLQYTAFPDWATVPIGIMITYQLI